LFASSKFTFYLSLVGSYRQWRWNEFEIGHRSGAKVGGGHRSSFLVVPLHVFGSKSTIIHFGERFRDGHYSLVSFLFAVLLFTVPPCPAICKSGGTCPRALWSRRHWP